MTEASPRPLLLVTAGLAIAVAITGVMVWQAHAASTQTERLLRMKAHVERIGELYDRYVKVADEANAVGVAVLADSGAQAEFERRARRCFEHLHGPPDAPVTFEYAGFRLSTLTSGSSGAVAHYLDDATCDVPELDDTRIADLLDRLTFEDDKLRPMAMRVSVRADTSGNWHASIRVAVTADDIKSLDKSLKVEIDKDTNEFFVQGGLGGVAQRVGSVWVGLLKSAGSADRVDAVSWIPTGDDAPCWAEVEALSPTQALARIGDELSGARRASTAVAVASYVVPIAAVAGLAYLIAMVARLVLRVHRWSDRVNEPMDRWMRWVWISVALGCATVWLPAALGGGWHEIRASGGAMPVSLAIGLLAAPTAVLVWLVVRLQSTLRRNRRES